MKLNPFTQLPLLALPLAFAALVACGPDKHDSPGEKADDALEEAGDTIEEGAEEVGDEIDDATDDN